MSLRAKFFALICLLPLAACGFSPVYGKHAGLPKDSPITKGVTVTVDTQGNAPIAAQFKNNLEDLLNPEGRHGQPPAYKMAVAIRESSSAIGVARDGTAARYNLTLYTTYTITRNSDNKIVGTGSVSNVTSYNNPANLYFSTYISEQDARSRGITELAEAYRQRLASFVENEKIDPTKIKTPTSIVPPIPTYENRYQVN